MRKIKKKKTMQNKIVIILFLIIFTTSTGYALLSESIKINGTATASYVVSGNAMDLNLLGNGIGGATYTSGTFPTTFATLVSENLSTNNLTLTFNRSRKYTSYVSCRFIINFTNPYPYSMKSGTRTNTTVSGGTNVSTFSSTLSSTSIPAGGTGKLTVSVKLRTSLTTVINLQTKMTYVINGVTQNFYYNIVVN